MSVHCLDNIQKKTNQGNCLSSAIVDLSTTALRLPTLIGMYSDLDERKRVICRLSARP